MKNELINKFNDWEEKNNWSRFKVLDYPVYLIIRLDLLNLYITKGNSIKDIIFQKKNISDVSFINKVISSFYALFGLLTQRKIISSKILGFTTSRNIILNKNKSKDKFLSYFFDNFPQRYKPLILETPNFEGNLHPNFILGFNKQRYPLDILYFQEVLAKDMNHGTDDFIVNIVDNFSKFFYNVNRVELDKKTLIDFFNLKINKNLKRVHVYSKYFNNCNPLYVFVTSYYSPQNMILVYLFKKKGARVFELQHSHIYSEHSGYIIPKNDKLCKLYYPDSYLVHGEYYKNLLNKYISLDKIKNVGKYNFDQSLPLSKMVKYKVKETGKIKVLIINQFTISELIVSFLLKSEQFSEYLFFIKLHPSNIKNQLSILNRIKNNNNICIILNDDFYSLAKEMDAFIGVYSTALVESLFYRKPSFRLQDSLHPQFDELVIEGLLVNIESLYDFDKVYNKKNITLSQLSFFDKPINAVELL